MNTKIYQQKMNPMKHKLDFIPELDNDESDADDEESKSN